MSNPVLDSLVTRFEGLEASLNQLDAATGDGDHGTTMLKGLRAAAGSPVQPVKAFRRAAGGASGSLFAVVIGALHEVMSEGIALPAALTAATEKIIELGQAQPGDKTMLDALIPAAAESSLNGAAMAARRGCSATVQMSAKRGRAKHVEGAGVGHVDAGATSVAEILEDFAQSFQQVYDQVHQGDA